VPYFGWLYAYTTIDDLNLGEEGGMNLKSPELSKRGSIDKAGNNIYGKRRSCVIEYKVHNYINRIFEGGTMKFLRVLSVVALVALLATCVEICDIFPYSS